MKRTVLVELVYQKEVVVDIPEDDAVTTTDMIEIYEKDRNKFLSGADFKYFNYTELDEDGMDTGWTDVWPNG